MEECYDESNVCPRPTVMCFKTGSSLLIGPSNKQVMKYSDEFILQLSAEEYFPL